MIRFPYLRILFVGAVLAAGVAFFAGFGQPEVDFNRQVKPLLNKKCIVCHGGVKRQGGFSLLFRSDALGPTENGRPAILPGDPDHSPFMQRLTSNDPEERMPYQEAPLSRKEIRLLRRWIREGAKWGEHWAYVPLRPVEAPAAPSGWRAWFGVKKDNWSHNEIDRFIQAGLRANGLYSSPPTDAATLLRRLSLDLTGLPAPPAAAAVFLADTSDSGYERLVDTLLASPTFGEYWAAMWLDLARYADTKGYERDDSRSIWRYRDWLIQAFNADMPYDQFLTEQLAGDLLPNPTDAQYLATAFHRNTMTNDEGGTDNEEFRVAALLDRVNTTWEVLLGTTFACAQCHSHPYDPFRQEEYYRFAAFFNNTRDEDTYGDYPLLFEYEGEDSMSLARIREWLTQHVPDKPGREALTFLRTRQPAVNSLLADQFIQSELIDTKWLGLRNQAICRLPRIRLDGREQLLFRYQNYAGPGVWTIHLDRPDSPAWLTVRMSEKTKGWDLRTVPLPAGSSGVHDLYFRYQSPALDNPDAYGLMFDWFYFSATFPGKGLPGYEETRSRYEDLLRRTDVRTTPVVMENPPDMRRATHVFERGNWMTPGVEVEPGVPNSLPPFPADAPRNRLGLARWMTSEENPLVARTIVNRIWGQFFGRGLAETLEDLGTQGDPPTHPELLDWLAWRLIHDHHWRLKPLMRDIVLSATYRQDSRVSPEALVKDPDNRNYTRAPRVRLSGEQLRDQALAVSGLLSSKMLGPSVFPTQPPGIWMSPWNGQDWRQSQGEDQYRRAVYTYWKRSSPYPSMMTFDATSREVCTARRIRTNTPLQALVTLNDEAFVEAARHLAFRMRKEGGRQIPGCLDYGYRLVTGKAAPPGKLAVLERLYHTSLTTLQQDPGQACYLVDGWDDYNNPETAAMVVVANAMLNLDEVITKN